MFDDSPTSFHVQSFLLSLTNSSHSTIYTNLLYNALKGKMWSGVNMKAIIQINVSIKSPIGWNVAVYHTDDISDRVKFIYVTNNTLLKFQYLVCDWYIMVTQLISSDGSLLGWTLLSHYIITMTIIMYKTFIFVGSVNNLLKL